MSKQLVLAFFDNEAAADQAVDALKQWDKASKDIKLGAIGILVKDDNGKIKTHKLGKRKTGTGAVLFGLATVLTGGTLLAGVVLGGIVGSFFRKGLGMSKEDLARIDGKLVGGTAAVCILAAPDEAAAVSTKLAELGGKAESYEISDEVVQEAATAAAEMPEEATEATTEPAAAVTPEPAVVEPATAPGAEETAKPASA
jgi:uncharacterized membrane protein